jgi:hypothetical protein
MEDAWKFVKAHPLLAGFSFVGGGGAGYGVSHHFLDFDTPFAVGAGAATGTALVLGESYVWNFFPEFAASVASTLAPVTQPVADATSKAVGAVANSGLVPDSLAEATGLADNAKFSASGDIISGQHQIDDPEESRTFWEWIKDGQNRGKQQAFFDAVRKKHGTLTFN